MQQKERRALDRCFDGLLRDLDPSTSFLHSLYAENVLTEEQVDRISVRMFFLICHMIETFCNSTKNEEEDLN